MIRTISDSELETIRNSLNVEKVSNKKNKTILLIMLITLSCMFCGLIFYFIKPFIPEKYSKNPSFINFTKFFFVFDSGMLLKFLFFFSLFINIFFATSGISSEELNILRKNNENINISIEKCIYQIKELSKK